VETLFYAFASSISFAKAWTEKFLKIPDVVTIQ